MPRPVSGNQILTALRTLDVLQRFEQVVNVARETGDLPTVKALLEAFKIEAEAKYRSLALECHPDRGGDEGRMQEINAAWDIVKLLNVKHSRPRPQPVVVRMHVNMGFWGGGGGTAATNSGTSYTATGDGWVHTEWDG